jgi:nucleoside-diphosphate-sugar epimerase
LKDPDLQKRVLITGASGAIGVGLCKRMLADGHSIVCLSRVAREDQPNLSWIKHDLAHDPWTNLPRLGFDLAFHLAGQTSTYKARLSPIQDACVNVLGTLNLLEYLRAYSSLPFVIIVGTATEVGLSDTLPINERLRDNPVTFYDVSKLTGEMYLIQYVREGWVMGSALRLANVFGRRTDGQQVDRGILDKVFSQAKLGKAVTIYGDGSYVRDYIFIDDVVSALVAATNNQNVTNGRYFYIGTGQGTTIKDAFAKVIALATGAVDPSCMFQYVPPPNELSPIEFRNAVIDSTAFRQATGWAPKYDFDRGLFAAYGGCL